VIEDVVGTLCPGFMAVLENGGKKDQENSGFFFLTVASFQSLVKRSPEALVGRVERVDLEEEIVRMPSGTLALVCWSVWWWRKVSW